MGDLIVGLGLVLVIEGLIWALAPSFGMRLLAAAVSTPYQMLRLAGALSVAAGVLLVWIVRG
ncbi:MAG: DUF2065 domain-containing protein [Hyphomicrobiaceae bacterium]